MTEAELIHVVRVHHPIPCVMQKGQSNLGRCSAQSGKRRLLREIPRLPFRCLALEHILDEVLTSLVPHD